MAEEEKQTEEEFFKPGELFRLIDEVITHAPPLEPLWGDFLFKKTVTSIVGDPGICKTTMGYGLAGAGCLGQPFIGINFVEPTVVLYMDFESADSLVASRASLVFGDTKIPNFYIYNALDYYLKQVAKPVIDFCQGHNVNLLFIDNQTAAFNTRDENDNSEAASQMRFIRQITQACNTATVIFHHTSKANLPGVRKGTGAFARARLADICINLDYPEEDNEDLVSFQVAKNRLVGEKPFWYLKKEGGQFVIIDPPLGVIGKPAGDTKIYKAQEELLDIMRNNNTPSGKGVKFETLVDAMQERDFSESWTDHALRRLVLQNRIWKPGYGYYAIKEIVKK